MNTISFIIVTENGAGHLKQCLDSVYANAQGFTPEVIVVDQNSTDNTLGEVAKNFPKATVISNSVNIGIAAARNKGLKVATGDVIFFVPQDIALKPGAAAAALDYLKSNPQCGIVGGKNVEPKFDMAAPAKALPGLCNKLFSLTGLPSMFPRTVLNWRDYAGFSFDAPTKVCWTYGSFFAVRADLFAKLGRFDERFLYSHDDADLCFRAHRSIAPRYSVAVVPSAQATKLCVDGCVRCADKTCECTLAARFQACDLMYMRKNHGPVSTVVGFAADMIRNAIGYCIPFEGREKNVRDLCGLARAVADTSMGGSKPSSL